MSWRRYNPLVFDPFRTDLFGRSEEEPAPNAKLGLEREYQQALASTSNRLARQVLQTAHDHLVGLQIDPRTDGYLSRLGWDSEYGYRLWVRNRIASADLAQRIASGGDLFDAFLDAIPSSMRQIEMFFRPRTITQQVEHVLRNLEWYLDPAKPPLTKAAILPLLGAVFFSGLTLSGLSYLTIFAIMPGIAASLSIQIVFATLLIVLVIALWSGFRSGESVTSGRYAVNVAEFYNYIVQAYTDVADLPSRHAGASSGMALGRPPTAQPDPGLVGQTGEAE